MSQVAKTSISTPIFLGLSALLALSNTLPEAVAILVWLGGIQILNSSASRIPLPRSIHWLHAMTFEVFAFLGVTILRLIPIRQTVSGHGQPILLIHGYMNHGKVWTLHKKRLEAQGFGPIYALSLGYPFRSIRKYAEKVKLKVEEIAKEAGRNDLIIVGHSMGGLVGSLYATQLAPAYTVTDVITIGSPLSGTPIARIGPGANAREMEPNSALTQELRQAIAQNKQTRFHHMATLTDQIVIPGASAVIPENNHFIFHDMGHMSLLYSLRVTDKIIEWITPKK